MTQDTNGLQSIDIPVPETLERALGYPREGRYLAIWWEPAGDEAVWDDGRVSADAYWPAFLAYVRHPRVEPHLAPFNLGSSDWPATHRLLLDLVERRAYVGAAQAVAGFLRAHTPRPAPMDPETLERFIQATRETASRVPDAGTVMHLMAARQWAVEDLERELGEVQKGGQHA